jgi:hypothetical protein
MDLNIDQLFTTDSLLTLQGAAAAAWVVPNVLGSIFPIPNRVRAAIALVIALGLSFWTASLGEGNDVVTWVVATLNGFLIAGSALGFNQATRGKGTADAPMPQVPATVGPAEEGYADRAPSAAPPAPAGPPPAPRQKKSARGFNRSWL